MGSPRLLNKKIAGILGMLAIFPFQNLIDPLGLLERLAPEAHKQYRCKTAYAGSLAPGETGFQWLGTTGFKIQQDGFVMLIDPYLSRIPFPQLFLARLEPDGKLLEEKIPKADYIFITESHFDHFLDTPAIALRTGAKVVGPPTAAKLLRVFKVPEEQIIEVKGGETLQAGPFTVQVGRAEHGNIMSMQLFHGDVDEKLVPPLTVWDYRSRENRCYRFSGGGISVFATSGSDLSETALPEFQSQVLIANVTALPRGYIEKLLRLTRPMVVFPTHYDNFFEPFSKGVQPFPILDLKIFCEEVSRRDAQTEVFTLDFFQEYRMKNADALSQANPALSAP